MYKKIRFPSLFTAQIFIAQMIVPHPHILRPFTGSA